MHADGEQTMKPCPGAMATPLIRLARAEDLDAVNAIYNHYVRCSTCTYQETPESIAGRREWFAHHDAAHPVTIAEANGQIVGWGSLSPYHARSAYRYTVEDSVYVDPAFQGCGIGSALLRDMVERARTLGHHVIIAGIDASQTASLGLHAKFGFEQVGYMREVGFKYDRWLDVIYMELRLRAETPPASREQACRTRDGVPDPEPNITRHIPMHQVDAFTGKLFGGNPAAVCILKAWLEDDLLQAIAAENNLSETAFLFGG